MRINGNDTISGARNRTWRVTPAPSTNGGSKPSGVDERTTPTDDKDGYGTPASSASGYQQIIKDRGISPRPTTLEHHGGFVGPEGPAVHWQKMNRKPDDMVNHPPHYRDGWIECIDAIAAQLSEEEYRGYLKGNIAKYVWREKHKGGTESLQKAQFYLNRLLKLDDQLDIRSD